MYRSAVFKSCTFLTFAYIEPVGQGKVCSLQPPAMNLSLAKNSTTNLVIPNKVMNCRTSLFSFKEVRLASCANDHWISGTEPIFLCNRYVIGLTYYLLLL